MAGKELATADVRHGGRNANYESFGESRREFEPASDAFGLA
jgi:hypothetical protein